LTFSITDTDGGTQTGKVTGIDIDLGKPSLQVEGVTKGKRYTKAPTLRCVANDALSGVASCVIHRSRTTSRGVRHVHYTAIATDVAGNTRTVSGSYSVKS
jgi:hypothetical protein